MATTASVSDHDALIAAIGYEPVEVSVAGHPGLGLTHRTVSDRDGLVRRILAAGFTQGGRSPVNPYTGTTPPTH